MENVKALLWLWLLLLAYGLGQFLFWAAVVSCGAVAVTLVLLWLGWMQFMWTGPGSSVTYKSGPCVIDPRGVKKAKGNWRRGFECAPVVPVKK
jgi:hypothetical protein